MHANLSRLTMYYEDHGDPAAPPVVLLHGGMSGAQTWSEQLDVLVKTHRVLVPEQQGHAHTPDVDGPLTYQAMANDTVEFIERIAGGPALVVGHSDGGVIGLLLALQRPDLVKRLVAIGANFHHEGVHSDTLTAGAATDDDFAKPRDRYAELSPDGAGHWPVIFDKTQQMWLSQPTLTLADIAAIAPPTLVMVGDDDVIAHAHSVELYQALPEGQLAIVPGTSHGVRKEKPALVNHLILDFLTDPLLPSEHKANH
jgi:pimeloyl-ACP methyl ester carboxylesterase